MLVDVGDTRLHVEERGAGDLALIALHGGPGLDHTMFGHWLDPEDGAYRLLLVGAELVVFEHGGHMAFVEEPDAYRATLRRVLARV